MVAGGYILRSMTLSHFVVFQFTVQAEAVVAAAPPHPFVKYTLGRCDQLSVGAYCWSHVLLLYIL